MAEGSDEVTQPIRRVEPPGSTPAASEELKERARQGDEVAATRAEIEQTRAEMGQTIDALQEKLDPQRLKEQAKTQATERARDTASGLLETIKRNPAPAAIAGAAVGLLFVVPLLRGRGTNTVVVDLRSGRIRNA